MAAVLPDDIRDIRNMDLPQQVMTLYNYIKYIKDQLDFWGSNRNKDIFALQEAIASGAVVETGTSYMKIGDGTMIQYGTGRFEIPPATQVTETVEFAVPFTATPIVVANSLTTRPTQLAINPYQITKTQVTFAGWNDVSGTTSYNTYYTWIAIGRWK